MVDGIVFSFLISRDLAVTAADKVKTDGGMQSIVICVNAALL